MTQLSITPFESMLSNQRTVISATDLSLQGGGELNMFGINLLMRGIYAELTAQDRVVISSDDTDVDIEGTTFNNNDVTVADDLTVNNDIIVSSQATVGGPKAFTFGLNVYTDAGKPGGGLWSVFSDQRLKENINTMGGSLDTLDALRPVTFNYSNKDHFSYVEGTVPGFIAQEVQRVIPEWVETGDDGYLYLNPIGYEAMVIDAIQELRDEKDAQIEQMQVENDELRQRLERLEAMMLRMSERP